MEKKRFDSAISLPFYVGLFVLLGLVFALLAIESIWIAALVLLPINFLIISMLVQTYYLIDDGRLVVVCGKFFRKTIDITSIRLIRKTTSLENAPALDFKHRIEIRYNQHHRIIISPLEQCNFIELLLQINPDISNKVNGS